MEISVATNHVTSVDGTHGVNLLQTNEPSKLGSTSKKQSEYFCSECQRGLSDESAYEKHLKSELHFKRSLKLETVIESKQSRNAKVMVVDSDVSLKATTPKSTEKTNKSDLSGVSSKYQICPTCHSTVEKLKFGKHLVSHYHHHMSSLSGSKEKKDALILDNIDKVVKECPFQCLICSFFCNWEHDFFQHWQLSHCDELTLEKDLSENMVYWCSLCQISAPTCDEMSVHLSGTYHNEILSVINRCVPMIIKVQKSLATYKWLTSKKSLIRLTYPK